LKSSTHDQLAGVSAGSDAVRPLRIDQLQIPVCRTPTTTILSPTPVTILLFFGCTFMLPFVPFASHETE
jgi:hypothetical protein